MKNLCGKCNVCCTACRIDKSEFTWRDTDKEAGETCDKLIKGRCGIYKKRPKACRTFECLWLVVSKSPKGKMALKKWRPDNIGILTKATNFDDKILFRVEELEEGKINFQDSDFLGFIDMLFNLSRIQDKKVSVVLFYFGDEKGYELTQK